MEFINLTAHTINETITGNSITPSGIVARAKQNTYEAMNHADTPIFKTKFTGLAGLPEPEEGVIYIVSSLALQACPADRADVVAPGNVQRNENGKIIGCCGFRAPVNR